MFSPQECEPEPCHSFPRCCHIYITAHVTGGLECPVRSGPLGGSSRGGCFLSRLPQNRKKKGKVTERWVKRHKNNKWKADRSVWSVICVGSLDCIVFSEFVPTPRPRPLLLPSAVCPAAPPPPATLSSPPSSGSEGLPRKTRQSTKDRTRENGVSETDSLSSAAVGVGVILPTLDCSLSVCPSVCLLSISRTSSLGGV